MKTMKGFRRVPAPRALRIGCAAGLAHEKPSDMRFLSTVTLRSARRSTSFPIARIGSAVRRNNATRRSQSLEPTDRVVVLPNACAECPLSDVVSVMACAMEHDATLLLGRLGRNKAHAWSHDCFADGLGIGGIILLTFEAGLQVGGWHQAHGVAESLQLTRSMM
jgi:hypothetical protein